jgi:DNA polymerase III subunit delta'
MSNPPIADIYPWQHRLYQKLLSARLPHALLFSGAPGLGKIHFATYFAHARLCHKPQAGAPCGVCKSCLLLRAGNHPDLRIVTAEAPGKQIKVDTIRALADYCALTAQYGRGQVLIIHPAEAMNIYAANSLLKLLEEPPAATTFMLISDQSAQLLPTVRSRCQRLEFGREDRTAARAWLQAQLGKNPADPDLLLELSEHAPLAALALAQKLPQRQSLFESVHELLQNRCDPLQTAALWVKMGSADSLLWLLSWTQDLARCSVGGGYVRNRDQRNVLEQWGARLNPARVFQLLEQEEEALRLLRSSANIREQGMMEEVALAWLALATRGA